VVQRSWTIALVALALSPAAAAACERPRAPAGWAPGVQEARAWAATRSHDLVAFSVRAGARAWHHHPDRVTRTASVAKAVMLAAQLRRLRARPVPRPIGRDLDAMVRASDNPAADRTFVRLGAPLIERTARRAGMRAFRAGPAGFWGGSRLTARDGARLMQAIPSLLPRRHRALGLRLLRTVVPSQRWGIGRAVPRGWRLHLKGGWGAGTGQVNHQVALLTRGCEHVALAVLTTEGPDHGHGTRTLEGVARRLLRGL
jgi:hypothetical protein